LSGGSALVNYNQAWSMVHFLVYGDGGKYVGPFESYLKHLNNGMPSDKAFVRAFGPDIVAFENRWKQYALSAKPSSFVSAMERMEFLAEGALQLSRQKKHPATLEELKSALKEIDFTHVVKTHGAEVKLNARDDALFTIPMDDLTTADQPPVFVVTKAKFGRLSRKEQMLEEQNPTPAVIATENLKPRSMSVRWIRDKEKNTFSYQIVIK
jgi:hypothetical protein